MPHNHSATALSSGICIHNHNAPSTLLGTSPNHSCMPHHPSILVCPQHLQSMLLTLLNTLASITFLHVTSLNRSYLPHHPVPLLIHITQQSSPASPLNHPCLPNHSYLYHQQTNISCHIIQVPTHAWFQQSLLDQHISHTYKPTQDIPPNTISCPIDLYQSIGCGVYITRFDGGMQLSHCSIYWEF